MSRRVLTSLFSALLLFLSIPYAAATDIPTLTWERGKVQSIVVGNAAQQPDWTIKLLSERVSNVTFSPSRVNERGFIVYSVELESALPLGQYSVVVFGAGNSGGTEIAFVQVTELKAFSILNSKQEIGLLGFLLTLIMVLLSTLKARKYSHISFLRQDKLNQDDSLLYAKNIPRFLYRFYLYRINSLQSFKPSLMRFLMEFDDSFLHKSSPLAWVLLPTAGLFAGIHAGLLTGPETLKFPILSLALLIIISVIDAYCAIFVISGFVMAQITLGEVMNLRTVIEIATLGLTLVGTSLISSYLQLVFKQTMRKKTNSWVALPKLIFSVSLSSSITAAFFFLAFLLAQSLSNDTVMARGEVIIVSLVAGLVSALKYYLHQKQDIKILGGERMASLKEAHHNVEQIISPFWNTLIVLSSFFGAFVWTKNWAIALIFGLLNVVFFGLLLVQFPIHNFNYVLKWERSLVIEPILFALITLGLYGYIDNLPLQASDRSIIFIIGVYLISIIHNVMSQLAEITQQTQVSHK